MAEYDQLQRTLDQHGYPKINEAGLNTVARAVAAELRTQDEELLLPGVIAVALNAFSHFRQGFSLKSLKGKLNDDDYKYPTSIEDNAAEYVQIAS